MRDVRKVRPETVKNITTQAVESENESEKELETILFANIHFRTACWCGIVFNCVLQH